MAKKPKKHSKKHKKSKKSKKPKKSKKKFKSKKRPEPAWYGPMDRIKEQKVC